MASPDQFDRRDLRVIKHILLLSNSTSYHGKYLDYAESEIRDLLGNRKRLLFVPFALLDRDGYGARAQSRFGEMGYAVTSLHQATDMQAAIEETDAVFIGGGNTFRLLKCLCESNVLGVIRKRVAEGMPYIGSSAGSNVACPTIKTTNDMPIVQPPSLDALGLVEFQINPHYQDPDPASQHMGETREQRIMEFHEENTAPVVGLREGAMLRVEGESTTLNGTAAARIFRKGLPPIEVQPGTEITDLLGQS